MKLGRILLIGLICGLVFKTTAQTDMNSIFSSDKNIIYTNQPKEYTGTPLVFIEGVSDKPQPKDWKDELKIKLFGSMELPKAQIQHPLPPLEQKKIQNGLKIHSLFGGEKEVLFVPHTNEWNFIIQILNDKEVSVEENIQFIVTDEKNLLQRDWPVAQKDFVLLNTYLNGQKIAPNLSYENDFSTLKLPELKPGNYHLRLSYLLKSTGHFNSKSASVLLPLTGTKWNLETDSFSGIVLFPTQITSAKADFLLGKNNQQIPNAFDSQFDEKTSLFFKSSHLLPALAQIKLQLNFNFDSFPKKSFMDNLLDNTSYIIFIIAFIIILLYLFLFGLEFKMTSDEEMIHQKKWIHIKNNSFNFLNRIFEIMMGVILLWIGTAFILYFSKTSFSAGQWILLIFIPIVIILLMDYFLFEPRQRKLFLLRGMLKLSKEDK